MTSDGQPYHRVKYKQIVAEQVTIGLLSKGGVSFSESNEMTPYERKIAFDTLKELLDPENKPRSSSSKRDTKKDPKSGKDYLI